MANRSDEARSSDHERRELQMTSNCPVSASSSERGRSSRSTVARNPIRPKLIANTGTPVPACLRSARSVAPSPPSTMQMSACGAPSLARSNTSSTPAVARSLGRAAGSPPRSPRGRSCVKTSTVRIVRNGGPAHDVATSSSVARARP